MNSSIAYNLTFDIYINNNYIPNVIVGRLVSMLFLLAKCILRMYAMKWSTRNGCREKGRLRLRGIRLKSHECFLWEINVRWISLGVKSIDRPPPSPDGNINSRVFRSHGSIFFIVSHYIPVELGNLKFVLGNRNLEIKYWYLERKWNSRRILLRFASVKCETVSRTIMICVTTRHFRYNRILLLMVGLWPYQQSKVVQFQLVLFFGILISFIISQVHSKTYF